jgi:protease-4
MSRFWKVLGILVILMMVGGFLMVAGGIAVALKGVRETPLERESILVLDLEGIILDSKKFLKDLREYRKKAEIKGVLVRVDSPGGVVGTSQELYHELVATTERYKKPVVVSGRSLIASGAYYASLAADKIYINEGALVGSIGVIMEFANLEKLYDWMKINRYVIKTGKFKDTGSEHRPISDEEKAYLQNVVDKVLVQFKKAVQEKRKMSPRDVDEIADGRIMTGQEAVDRGLADKVGTFSDAVREIGEMTGLGEEPRLFEPPKKSPPFIELFSESYSKVDINKTVNDFLKTELFGRPLFIMPGVLTH